MDLSGLIFVVLAVAWAGYLIPRALRQHDELAASRPVETFSHTLRVLDRSRGGRQNHQTKAATAAPEAPSPAPRMRLGITRVAARRAAQRRRRILLGLLLLTAVVAGVAGFAVVPWWGVTVAGGLVVAWLVTCRVAVRRQNAHVAPPLAAQQPPEGAPAEWVAAKPDPVDAAPVGTQRVEERSPIEGAEDAEDDGALWDPLPLTLPTYVTKPAARRTVRTIDLTQGTTPSEPAKPKAAPGESASRKAV